MHASIHMHVAGSHCTILEEITRWLAQWHELNYHSLAPPKSIDLEQVAGRRPFDFHHVHACMTQPRSPCRRCRPSADVREVTRYAWIWLGLQHSVSTIINWRRISTCCSPMDTSVERISMAHSAPAMDTLAFFFFFTSYSFDCQPENNPIPPVRMDSNWRAASLHDTWWAEKILCIFGGCESILHPFLYIGDHNIFSICKT